MSPINMQMFAVISLISMVVCEAFTASVSTSGRFARPLISSRHISANQLSQSSDSFHRNVMRYKHDIHNLYAVSNRLNSQVNDKVGGHADNFKYLPISTAQYDEFYPRILPIAGVYPDVTVDQLMSPKSTPAAAVGMWTYEFTDPAGSQLGTVALPGSDVLSEAVDPVVLIAKNTDLNIQILDETEILIG
jgi:hypothetical protein